jgi:hypothetical protein
MPIHSIRDDGVNLELCAAGGKCVTIPYASLTGTRLEGSQQIIDLIYAFAEVKIRRNQLKNDDEDKAIDPARESLFWRRDGNTDYLVGRSFIIDSCVWSDADQKHILSIRRPVD